MSKLVRIALMICGSLIFRFSAEARIELKPTPEAQNVAPPPPRTRAEVETILTPGSKPKDVRPLRVLLVAGPKDHGPGEHDYPAWRKSWKELLGGSPGVTVDTAENWPEAAQWEKADLAVFFLWNHDWSAARYKDLDAFLARGGGIVALHAAVIADKEPEELAKRIGLSSQPGRTKFRHGPLDLTVTADADEPITRGLKTIHFVDETYWPPIGDAKDVHVLATAVEEGKAWPMLWTYEVGKGRVFCCVLGHYTWTFDDPLFRVVILRGMAWAAKEPTRRFEELAIKGVKLAAAP